MGISFLPKDAVQSEDYAKIADGMTLEVVGAKYQVVHRKAFVNKDKESVPEQFVPSLVVNNVRRDQQGDEKQYTLELGLGKKFNPDFISKDGDSLGDGSDETVGIHADCAVSRFIANALEKGGALFTEDDAQTLVNSAKSLVGMVWVAGERSAPAKGRMKPFNYIAPIKILSGPGGRKGGAKTGPKAEAPAAQSGESESAVLAAVKSVLSEKYPDGISALSPLFLAAVLTRTAKPHNSPGVVKGILSNPELLATGAMEGMFQYDLDTNTVRRQ